MCYETSTHLQSSPMNSPTSPKPARRTRTKTRKPKYVSLRQELSPETSESSQLTHHQLTLFPLHPENLFEEKEAHEHVNYFFDQEEGGGAAASLNGILGGGGSAPPSSLSSSSSEEDSLTYAYGHGAPESEGSRSLERAAMRQRERDVSEEKWVVYSEVVERKRTSEGECYREQGLSLKLDYEEILNAWSDKGPLYIEGESAPQTVPDLAQDSTSVYTDVRYEKQVWNVPEDGNSVIEDGGEGKMAYREARVMRYKEKRQSRLFSKRIRYEVRKINAEKRPRIKGRFVKRKPEV